MISAIILAAGKSTRMGQPKMLLPWAEGTVLTHVISVFQNAGIEEIIVVTGGARESVEKLVSDLNARTIYNPEYVASGMIVSIQCGLRAVSRQTHAVLIGLGDQPQVQERSVRMVCEAFIETRSNIVVPSYQMRRGHPWLAARPFWEDLLAMKESRSPRDFINLYQNEIQYVSTDDPNILADLDTPEDYENWRK